MYQGDKLAMSTYSLRIARVPLVRIHTGDTEKPTEVHTFKDWKFYKIEIEIFLKSILELKHKLFPR